MNIVRHKDPDFVEKIREICAPSSLLDLDIENRARAIIKKVEDSGDEAVSEFTKKFDGATLTPAQFEVSDEEIESSTTNTSAELKAAVKFASENITFFSKESKRQNWTAQNKQGGKVGEKFDPFRRVGIYVPGGTAPLASTALMTITLAKVAGCPEIVVCTPCDKDG
ncbi:histidinol dehydrogenase, partial [bacterium]|nr:histidinol dehydrogenase [bacterium]